MSRRDAPRLPADMRKRIERIERYVAGLDRTAFLRDDKTSDSVVRSLEVIGEAANRLSRGFRERNSEIPCARIIGLRHRVVHAYFDVDLELVREIACTELPTLKAWLRSPATESEYKENGGAA